MWLSCFPFLLLWNRLIGKGNVGYTYSESKPSTSDAKEHQSKPSKSDANTSSDSKPCKSDAKELDTPSEQQVISMKDSILQKVHPFATSWKAYNDPTIWGVLTAITENAIQFMRNRGCQGRCIYLKMAQHCIGLLLNRRDFQIPNNAVNNDYGIYLTRDDGEETEHIGSIYPPVFLRDTSAFATYVNWKRLTKEKPVQICHGDIISLCAAPDDVNACGFVYQLAYRASPWQEGPEATIHEQFELLRNEFAEMKKLLCVKERTELKAELRTEFMAEISSMKSLFRV